MGCAACCITNTAQEMKTALSGSIIEMIKNKEAISDELLMVGFMLNSNLFEKTLAKSIYQSIAIDGDEIDKHKQVHDSIWFKKFILHSNIFALASSLPQPQPQPQPSSVPTASETKNNDSDAKTGDVDVETKASADDDDSSDTGDSKQSKNYLIIDAMIKNGIESELVKQQLFIKSAISSMKSKDSESWNNLVSLKRDFDVLSIVLSQNYVARADDKTGQKYNLMDKNGFPAKYKEIGLVSDYVSQFNGIFEYDYETYLTTMLIVAHRLNPLFQRRCEAIFRKEILGVECKFKQAPVKRKSRCQIKSAVEYWGRMFPKTASVIDLVCCIQFTVLLVSVFCVLFFCFLFLMIFNCQHCNCR